MLVFGCFFLWFKRFRDLGRIFITFSAIALILFSNTSFSNWLMVPLENQYASIPAVTTNSTPKELASCSYIVVLGSGNSNDERSALAKLSSSGLARITEAVRLANLLPQVGIIVSGPAYKDYPSHASVQVAAALELNVKSDRLIKVESAKDTEEEANAIRTLVGTKTVALVTSAWHMPRAVILFKKAGITVVPCPTDFTTHTSAQNSALELNKFNASLTRSTWAIHERLGLLWLKLRWVN
ncbi:MAG: YdcF family protein [Verrucomicrobia bacterium]|nr:MAG: YdcF family protein [Verrucomicrobiota bacterium]